MFLTGEAQVRSGQRAHDAKFSSVLLHFIVKTSRNFEHVIKSESCLIYSHDAYIISFDGLSIVKESTILSIMWLISVNISSTDLGHN